MNSIPDEGAARAAEKSNGTTSVTHDLPPFDLDLDVVRALHWCRLGHVRPEDDSAFHRARKMGLLAHDPTWRATEQGEGVLVALGLLKGKPAPQRQHIHILWATCKEYSRPQFVGAWSDGYVDCFSECYKDDRAAAERWFRDFGDEQDWTFFTTSRTIDTPLAEHYAEI